MKTKFFSIIFFFKKIIFYFKALEIWYKFENITSKGGKGLITDFASPPPRFFWQFPNFPRANLKYTIIYRFICSPHSFWEKWGGRKQCFLVSKRAWLQWQTALNFRLFLNVLKLKTKCSQSPPPNLA